MTGAQVRRASTLNKRINDKGAKRRARTAALVKINPAAKKQTMSGTMLVQIYGHTAQGASTTQQLGMRKNVKGATLFAGSGACTTTVIAFTFGPTADPIVKIPLEQIDAWIQTWLGTTREQ